MTGKIAKGPSIKLKWDPESGTLFQILHGTVGLD